MPRIWSTLFEEGMARWTSPDWLQIPQMRSFWGGCVSRKVKVTILTKFFGEIHFKLIRNQYPCSSKESFISLPQTSILHWNNPPCEIHGNSVQAEVAQAAKRQFRELRRTFRIFSLCVPERTTWLRFRNNRGPTWANSNHLFICHSVDCFGEEHGSSGFGCLWCLGQLDARFFRPSDLGFWPGQKMGRDCLDWLVLGASQGAGGLAGQSLIGWDLPYLFPDGLAIDLCDFSFWNLGVRRQRDALLPAS